MWYLLLATYGAVLFAELLGDKSIYTISSLTMRFRIVPVFCGLSAAFMGKMLVAVLVGRTVSDLPGTLTAATSAVTFFVTAAVIWFKKDDGKLPEREAGRSSARSALIAFAAIFFSEWGDVGQVTAATLTVQYKMPLLIWLSASLALMTKGLLSITLGVSITRYASKKVLRFVSVALCLTLGLFSIAGLLV